MEIIAVQSETYCSSVRDDEKKERLCSFDKCVFVVAVYGILWYEVGGDSGEYANPLSKLSDELYW